MAASGACDQGVWGAFAPFHGSSNDNIVGRGRLQRPEIVVFAERKDLCRQYSWSPEEKFISGVADTGEQFNTGVMDIGEQFISGDVDTGNNIFLWCRWYQSETTKKPKIYRQTAGKLFTGVNDTTDE